VLRRDGAFPRYRPGIQRRDRGGAERPQMGEIGEGMADRSPNGFEPEIIAFCCEH